MAKRNVPRKTTAPVTHEGGRAKRLNHEQLLRRSIMGTLLWEDQFYEDGQQIADRIVDLTALVDPVKVSGMAVEARNNMHLRHVPLWIVRAMAKLPAHKGLVAKTLATVIQRPDELSEFVKLYWGNGKEPLSAQVKKGLAAAFTKFDEYQLAKYNRATEITLRDVLFMCHAKPKDKEQEALWQRLIDDKLTVPDTWEVGLSKGGGKKTVEDKKVRWERLLAENKLGAMALLRNLRNMEEAGVDEDLVFAALDKANYEKVLPYRFIAAARYAKQWEATIEKSMLKALSARPKLSGKTFFLIDVSGSMGGGMSTYSEMRRLEAACALAMICRELCERVKIYTFSERTVLIPDRRGFGLADAILQSQDHASTFGGACVKKVNLQNPDRIIMVTDEQFHDDCPDPNTPNGYLVNVASNRPGVGYGKWTDIDGFSEGIFPYIKELETINAVSTPEEAL